MRVCQAGRVVAGAEGRRWAEGEGSGGGTVGVGRDAWGGEGAWLKLGEAGRLKGYFGNKIILMICEFVK